MDFQIWDGLENTTLFKDNITFLNTKKFTTVTLTGNNDSDRIKLKEAQKNIEKLVSSKDSINGIKFHFEPKSQYWSYVEALEIIQIEARNSYFRSFCYKDDILFTNPKPLKPYKPNKDLIEIQPIICGSGGYDTYIEESKIFVIWKNLIEISKKYYLPITAYILMVFFTFRRIINKNKRIP
nr:hypothetical protein [uncultured Flavobacterium sp.]